MMEYIGILSYQKREPKQAKIQRIYVVVHICLYCSLVGLHTFSTVTRSYRHVPEFCQVLLEDIVFYMNLGMIIYFNAKVRAINNLLESEAHSFSRSNPKLLRRVQMQATAVFWIITCMFLSVIVGILLEINIPMSSEEFNVRRRIYGIKNPERRLPFTLRVPFLDESESWTYEAIFTVSTYFGVILLCESTLMVNLIPVATVHMQGQYQILCSYVRMMGKEHTDADGNSILYTNIEDDEYVPGSIVVGTNESTKLKQKQRKYEQNYLKQIVRFHQKLMVFQKKVGDISQ